MGGEAVRGALVGCAAMGADRGARCVINEGGIGRTLAVRATRAYRIGGVWPRDGWREGDRPGGGVLLDQGTHQVSQSVVLRGHTPIGPLPERRGSPAYRPTQR